MTLGELNVAGDDNDPKHFNRPTDVAWAPNGDFFISDGYGNSRVHRLDRSGKHILSWGEPGSDDGQFSLPHNIAMLDDDHVIVCDRENARVQIFDTEGKLLGQWTDTGHPYGLYLHQGKAFLADGRSGLIRVLDMDGKLLTRWEAGDPKNVPHWLCLDRAGTMYVGFVYAKKLQKW